MNGWWKRRSLKLRLALWYAAVCAAVIAVFIAFSYETVEHRLRTEIDRQLRIDFDLVEAQLVDDGGSVSWTLRGGHGNEGFARLSAWFEVWTNDGTLLLRQWPTAEENIREPLSPPVSAALRFYTTELQDELHVRIMERPARIIQRGVMVRLLRDESYMRHALAQIVEGSVLVLPVAALLAGFGGYLIARKSLAPVARMAARAKKITSESLSDRLPNPNPHDELGELAAVFNQTLQRLEQSFIRLRQFTADASHELRTPVTALRAVGEVALREQGDATATREAISSMLEEAQHLEALIESLLTLARMDNSQAVIERQPVDLGALLRDVGASLDVLASDKGQQIELQCEAAPTVIADPMLLRQALVNIVHNAIRYSPRNAVIRLRTAMCDGWTEIVVEDSGPGIAPEHHERIFDRFFRVDQARSRDGGGHGLGLAIAKSAVERLGGRIELKSTRGEGSTFRVLLPEPERVQPDLNES